MWGCSGDIPEVFKDGPKATLVRYIMTPNYEFFTFPKFGLFEGKIGGNIFLKGFIEPLLNSRI